MATHRRKVNSLEQPVQLLHREAGHRAVFNRPDEAGALQAFLQQPEPVAIPPQYLDAVSPAVAKHKHRLCKGVQSQFMLDQACQAVDVLAKVDGIAVQVHAHVLLSFNDYQKLTKPRRNIADALAMPGIADIEFEPPRMTIQSRPADFS